MLHLALLLLSSAVAAPPAPPAPAAPVAPPTSPAPPASSTLEPGFTALFDGRDLAGWCGDVTGYAVENGAIYCGAKGTNLYTTQEYGNFVLRFEFQLTPGANNGIGVRAPTTGDAAYEGMEIQVLDDGHEQYRGKIKDWQHHGSVYGIVASRGSIAALKPTGQWNSEEIILDGRSIKVTLNGAVLVDANLDDAVKGGTLSGHAHPGLKRTTGRIGFLGHGDRVGYRNLRVMPLPERAAAATAAPAAPAPAPAAP